jgi:inorganic pyrophosphatase
MRVKAGWVRISIVAVVAAIVLAIPAIAMSTDVGVGVGDVRSVLKYKDAYTLIAKYDFLKGERKNADGTYNVSVEIPAGTNAKWETSPDETNMMFWEFKKGKPRVVAYLPYVGNYGSLVNSLGNDGDPMDVLILGPAVERGSIVRVKIIGVGYMVDGGDKDEKMIAVTEDGPMADVNDISELDARYPGVTGIISTWFSSYKGPGEIEWNGYGDAATAKAMADSLPPFSN